MRATAASVLLLLLLAGVVCSKGAPPASQQPAGGGIPQGHVYTGCVPEPLHLNPFTTENATARRYVLAFTHDTLLDSDPADGRLRASLATDWQLAADGLSFTLHLRPGVTFADGAPLTVDDVLYTWQVCRGEPTLRGSMRDGMDLVRDVAVVGDARDELRIELRARHFAALRAVGESWLVVQKRFFDQRLAELAKAAGLAKAPAPGEPGFGDLMAKIEESGPGSGPYRLGEWRRKQDLSLVRNDGSWRRSARPGSWNLGGVRLLFTDPAAVTGLLNKRAIDFAQPPGIDVLLARDPGLLQDYKKLVYDYQNAGVTLVAWNCRRGPLRDPRVRLALGMLFDRQAIARDILEGSARPAAAFARTGTAEYPADLAPLPFDPPAARALLRQAGHDPENGTALAVDLLVPAGDARLRAMLDLAVDAGRAAGVQIRFQVLDGALVAQRLNAGEWDGVLRWHPFKNWCDPYDLFHSQGGANQSGFADAECDRLLAAARVEADDSKRGELTAAFHRRAAELQPVALLVHPRVALLCNAHIEGAVPGPLGLVPERFWVPPAFQRH